MIKARKGHVSLRGDGGELFTDLRCIVASIRKSLVEHLGEIGTEGFIENAVKSSMTEEWAKRLGESEGAAPNTEDNNGTKVMCVRRGYGRHKSAEGVSVGTIYNFMDGYIVLDNATASPTVESVEELCRVLGHKFVPVDNIKEVKPVS